MLSCSPEAAPAGAPTDGDPALALLVRRLADRRVRWFGALQPADRALLERCCILAPEDAAEAFDGSEIIVAADASLAASAQFRLAAGETSEIWIACTDAAHPSADSRCLPGARLGGGDGAFQQFLRKAPATPAARTGAAPTGGIDRPSPLSRGLALGFLAAGRGPAAAARAYRELRLLTGAGGVDAEYYRRQRFDLANVRDAALHYLLFGWREGLNPRADFRTLDYLANNHDVRDAAVNPFAHFIRAGKGEQRRGGGVPAHIAQTTSRAREVAAPPTPISRWRAAAEAALAARCDVGAPAVAEKSPADPILSVLSVAPGVAVREMLRARNAARFIEFVFLAETGADKLRAAFDAAKGEVILFIAQDVVPLAGAVEALCAQCLAGADIATGRIVHQDGAALHAGGVGWANGDRWLIGRFEHPESAHLSYARQCDFAFNGVFAMSKRCWETHKRAIDFQRIDWIDQFCARVIDDDGAVHYTPAATIVTFSPGLECRRPVDLYEALAFRRRPFVGVDCWRQRDPAVTERSLFLVEGDVPSLCDARAGSFFAELGERRKRGSKITMSISGEADCAMRAWLQDCGVEIVMGVAELDSWLDNNAGHLDETVLCVRSRKSFFENFPVSTLRRLGRRKTILHFGAPASSSAPTTIAAPTWAPLFADRPRFLLLWAPDGCASEAELIRVLSHMLSPVAGCKEPAQAQLLGVASLCSWLDADSALARLQITPPHRSPSGSAVLHAFRDGAVLVAPWSDAPAPPALIGAALAHGAPVFLANAVGRTREFDGLSGAFYGNDVDETVEKARSLLQDAAKWRETAGGLKRVAAPASACKSRLGAATLPR